MMRVFFLVALWYNSIAPTTSAWRLEILVTSPWRNEERRNILRNALDGCARAVSTAAGSSSDDRAHQVSYHFFMGNVNDTRPSTEEAQTRVLYAAGRFLERDETFSAADAMMYERGEQLLPGEEPAFADPVVTSSDEEYNEEMKPGMCPPRGFVTTPASAPSPTRRDMVILNGPDLDPPVQRDVTYILDRPTSRAFRVAYGTRWVHCYLPDTDFIFYLDDDSFLNVPRLFHLLDGVQIAEDRYLQERKVDRNEKKLQLRYRNERNKVESLVLGYMMETDTDMGRYDICEMCDPCDKCLHDRQLKEFCGQEKLQHLSLGGCLAYMNTCKIYGDEKPLADCIYDAQFESSRIADYFGTKKSPLWLLGMGWLFGKRVINYIARNAADLKKRGAADLILGYWLTGIEDLNWVDTGPLGNFRFHDYPMRGNTFTRECHDETILVHRMTPKRWAQDFDAESCVLDCALERDPEVVGEGAAVEDSENPFGDETVRELERNPTGVKREAKVRTGEAGGKSASSVLLTGGETESDEDEMLKPETPETHTQTRQEDSSGTINDQEANFLGGAENLDESLDDVFRENEQEDL